MNTNHENCDVMTANEKFGYNPVNNGIMWCESCEIEFAPVGVVR